MRIAIVQPPRLYWAFINDYELDPGTDMQFPEQPDLSSVLTHM